MSSSIAGNGGIIGASAVPTAASPAAKITTITSNGCFNRAVPSATVIVVGGGGGGAQGGGGAGGVLVTECHPLPSDAVPVTIGAGGGAPPTGSARACSGNPSTFSSITSTFFHQTQPFEFSFLNVTLPIISPINLIDLS